MTYLGEGNQLTTYYILKDRGEMNKSLPNGVFYGENKWGWYILTTTIRYLGWSSKLGFGIPQPRHRPPHFQVRSCGAWRRGQRKTWWPGRDDRGGGLDWWLDFLIILEYTPKVKHGLWKMVVRRLLSYWGGHIFRGYVKLWFLLVFLMLFLIFCGIKIGIRPFP